MKSLLSSIAFAVAWLHGAAALATDVLTLKNGDRVSGRIARIENGHIEVSTQYAGAVRIDIDAVHAVEMDRDVTVVVAGRTRRAGRLAIADGRMAMRESESATPVPIDAKAVTALHDGRVPKAEWTVGGRTNVGASATSGNTELHRFNLDGEVIARRDRDRITTTGRANQATQHGTETEANAALGLKLDRFISRRQYAYAGATFEHDRLKDLRLRRTVGAGSGYQVLESERTSLALEAGLDRVLTDFFGSADEQMLAARLAVRFDHWIVDERLQIFHNEQTFVGITDVHRSFVRSQTGLRVPLSARLMASLHLNADWEGDPAAGRRNLDRTVAFTIGYRW